MPFKKGQPKIGGRKKGTPNKRSLDDLYQMCEDAQVEPFKVFLDLCKSRDEGIRLGAAKEAAKYIYSQKRITEISGKDGEPVEVSTNLKEILDDLGAIINTKVNERKT